MTQSPFPPPWEGGPAPADPALSASFGSYAGPGYGNIPGNTPSAPLGTQQSLPIPPAVQYWLQPGSLYVGNDGNVYSYSRVLGTATKVN